MNTLRAFLALLLLARAAWGAVLVSIGVTPNGATVVNGTNLQFTATGFFSDNSTQNITSTVTWLSRNPTVAAFSNAAGSEGLATAIGPGSCSIIASSPGVPTITITLTVTSATLVSIAVTPNNPTVAKGTSQQFTATGTFDNGFTQDLTSTVTWSSFDPSVVTISNAGGSRGLATGVATGSSTITATSGAVSANAMVTVTAPVLVSIEVTPANPSVASGLPRQFTATGTFSDGSSQDLTGTVTWSSSAPLVATISNTSGSRGLATGVAPGSSTIAATSGAVLGNTMLIVHLANPLSATVIASGMDAPGKNTNGLPGDAVIASFGVPAIDDAGDIAFVAKWTSAGPPKTKGTGLFLNDNCLAVIGGDASTIGGAGAQWKSFSDPVVEGGKLACIAKLSTGASAVVWNYVGTTLGTVARSGDTANLAPGLTQPDDPKFKSFKAVTIVGNEVAVLAQLATGSGTPKVTAADDVAVVHYHPLEGAVVVLREGQSVSGRKIKTLVSFAPGNGSPGCGRGYAVFPESGSTFAATALAIFDDKTQGLVQVHDYDPPTALSLGGDAATGVNNGATFASYSVPARNAAEAAAFRAVLTIANGVTKADANGIFRGPDVTGKFATVVRSGVNAGQAGTGAKFGALKDPVLNDADDIAFPATVTGVKGPGAQTLWVRPASGGLHMIAQGGADAGDLAGAKFKAFTSLAIAGGGRAAIFAATLLPNKTNVTAASANGVWAVDFNGNVRTLFRTGDQIDVGAPGTAVLRKVKSFTVLKALVGSTGVTRSFNDAGEVIWLATFTDKTQAIVTTEVP